MPRAIILGQDLKPTQDLKVGSTESPEASPGSPAVCAKGRRSQAYVDLMTRLDAGTHLEARQVFEELLAGMKAELGELGLPEFPLGLISVCRLGPPYQVHILEVAGTILRHVKVGEAMPAPFERARAFAMHPAYAFIEVFTTALHCVRADGSVTTI